MARLLALFSIVFLWPAFAATSQSLTTADSHEVQAAIGGACEDCEHDNTGPCVGTTCTANGNGTWTKKVGTLATPHKCVPGRPVGVDGCKSTLPTPCSNSYTCTDAACTNCGAAAANPPTVTTKCALSGTLCRVGS